MFSLGLCHYPAAPSRPSHTPTPNTTAPPTITCMMVWGSGERM